MNLNKSLNIALPKGRILESVLPILLKVGIEPEKSFFDRNDRKLKFKTNISNIDIIRVRSFDVVTFLAYSPLDLNIGNCKMVVAAEKDVIADEDPRSWSHVRVATKYPNITKKHFEARGVHAECIKLNGAMELAPSMGLCKRIVDLVETGSTLKANGLVVVEKICDVSTRLAVNRSYMKTNLNTIQPWIKKVEEAINV